MQKNPFEILGVRKTMQRTTDSLLKIINRHIDITTTCAGSKCVYFYTHGVPKKTGIVLLYPQTNGAKWRFLRLFR